MSAREIIIPVFVPHLGCPNDCVFCNQRRISGKQNPASADDVRYAIESGISRIGGKTTDRIQLAFYGGSFTAIPRQEQSNLLSAAKEYLVRGIIDSVRLSTRPDAIDGEILKRLKAYGVETIELGAQSLDDEVLALSGRGHTAADVEKASDLIKKSGYRLILQMMTGLPGDTFEKSLETVKRIIALKPDGVRIYPTVVVKDTALYDLWKTGRYSEHSVEDAVELCSVILPMFKEAGIPVIRLGLNPTDELSSGVAVAGAYHPALGELVMSRIMRNLAETLLDEKGAECNGLSGKSVKIIVNSSDVSKMIGQHKCNVNYLKEKFALSEVRIKSGECDEGRIRIILVENEN